MNTTTSSPTTIFSSVTDIAVLNGIRKLIDADDGKSPVEASKVLLSYVSKASPSEAAAKNAIQAIGGWIGGVESQFRRSLAKHFAYRAAGRSTPLPITQTLMHAKHILMREGIPLPTAEDVTEEIKWIIQHNALNSQVA